MFMQERCIFHPGKAWPSMVSRAARRGLPLQVKRNPFPVQGRGRGWVESVADEACVFITIEV